MTTTFARTATGISHSKIILVGEHAVVYGMPAIAIPFPLEVKATIEEKKGGIHIKSALFSGLINKLPVKLRGVGLCIEETLRSLNKPVAGLTVKIESQIPMGRGLGSSAAIAAAIVRSLFSFFERTLEPKELLNLVEIAEVFAHGRPSGIDMAAVSSEVPIWFQMGKTIKALKVGMPLHMVVADSGRIGDTKTAVKKVQENFLMDPLKTQNSIDQIGIIAARAKTALIEGNSPLLGRLLNENHAELLKLDVSDAGLNRLVEKARDLGALGAKLTGGGQGGCIIALARTEDQAKMIAAKLKDAGAYKTWYFTAES